MRVGIIGAGATGLTAAYDLVRAGHEVTLLEQSDELGGLAASISVGGTPLERYYHHIFGTDTAMIDLIGELGLAGRLRFHATTTGIFYDGAMHDFTSPADMLRFKPISLADRVRFGASSAALKVIKNGEKFSERRALDWTRRWAGKRATQVVWEPLLTGKFGDRAAEVSMAWLWARINCRTFKLGYLDGGFDQVYTALGERIADGGGKIEFGKRLDTISQPDAAAPVEVTTKDGASYTFDRVLATVPQSTFATSIGADPQDRLWTNQYLGATCFILEVDRSVIPYYWLNINDSSSPFLAVVEHTQMIPPAEYGGRHILYVGNYVARNDWRFTGDPGELLERFVPYLRKINPDFDLSWVQRWHFSKAGFAQPVVNPQYRALIPPHETPLPGVVLATMSQVYPQDRGQSYAVKMAREVVRTHFS